MTWPSLSIIIPSFNSAQYIERALLSIIKQNYQGILQIIVADGGSKDGTVDILKKYPQVTWWSKPDKGHLDAVNKALKVASGEIIAILPSDDFYLKNAFRIVMPHLINNSEIAFVSGAIGYWNVQKGLYYPRTEPRTYKISSPLKYIMREISIPLQCTFVKKEMFDNINVRAEASPSSDVDFLYRALHFYRGYILPEFIGIFQIHGGQLTGADPTRWIKSFKYTIESCEQDANYSKIFQLPAEVKNELFLEIEMFWLNSIGNLNEKSKAVYIARGILSKRNSYSPKLKNIAKETIVINKNLVIRFIFMLWRGNICKKLLNKVYSLKVSREIDIQWWNRP